MSHKSKQNNKSFLGNDICSVNQDILKKICNDLINIFFSKLSKASNYPNTSSSFFERDNFPLKGIDSYRGLLTLIESEIFNRSIYKSNQNYLKFIDNGENPINLIAATINSLLNQNLTSHLTDSPGATFNEISLLIKIRELIGYEIPSNKENFDIAKIGGYFTSGGMMGNCAALLIARNYLYPNAQQKGIPAKKPKLILPFFAAHYSNSSAMGWLGFGEDNVIYAPTNGFDYDIDELAKIINDVYSNGGEIAMITVSIGDPYSMSIQNIATIRKLCDKYNIWLHGDGANGGILIFSKKYKKLVRDIRLCDSVTLDPHKGMGLNYPCSVFMCKDFKRFNSVISYWNIVNKKDSLDLGIISPFLNSRGFDSFKLWLFIMIFGLDGVATIIDNKITTMLKIYNRLKDSEGVIFWNKPQTFSIVFQVLPRMFTKYYFKNMYNIPDQIVKDINDFQVKFQLRLEKETGILIHLFNLPHTVRFKNIKNCNRLATVLCIHNGHQSIDDATINKFKSFIDNYNF